MGARWKCGVVGSCLILGLGVALAVAADAPAPAPAGPAAAPAAPKYAYVGVNGCRYCHTTKSSGDQYDVWKKTKHATAYETLKSDEAIKMGAARGLKTAPVDSPECLRCHVTGWNLTDAQKAEFLKPTFKIEEGVQCETCHGPGDKYRTLTVMKNHEEAVKNGLILGDEKLCLTCHNDQSPAWKPDRFTTKDGKKVAFDYTTCWDMIKHPVPKEPAQP